MLEAGEGQGPRSYCLVSVLVSGRKLRCIAREELQGAPRRCRCYTEELCCEAGRSCTTQSSTSAAAAGRTCWASCGAAGAARASRRKVSPRDVSCRTGHSLSSGGIGHSGSPPPLGAGPCKCHRSRCCCCVGGAAGRHWSSGAHHHHHRSRGYLEAPVLAFESAAAHRNSKPEKCQVVKFETQSVDIRLMGKDLILPRTLSELER